MFYLNDKKDFKIYRGTINGIERGIDDLKRNQFVLNLGNSEESLIKLLNSDLLKASNFFSLYYPRKYITQNRKVRQIINQEEYYKNISNKAAGRTLRTRRNIENYSKYNLIMDASTLFRKEQSSLVNKSKIVGFNNLDQLINNSIPEGYDNVILLFNMDTDGSVLNQDLLNIGIDANPLSYLDFAIRRNKQFTINTADKNVTLLVAYPSNNTFMKIDLSKEGIWDTIKKNRSIIKSRMTAMSNMQTYDFIEDNDDVDDEIKAVKPVVKAVSPSTPVIDKFGMVMKTDKTTEVEITPPSKIVDPSKIQKNIKKNNAQTKLDLEIEETIENISLRFISDDIKNIDSGIREHLTQLVHDKLTNDKELRDKPLEERIELVAKDELVLSDIMSAVTINSIGKKNSLRMKATENLLEKQNTAINSNEKLKEQFKKSQDKSITITSNTDLDVLNAEATKSIAVNDFDDSYMDKQFDSDIVNTFSAFSENEDVPIFIDKIAIEDDSDIQTNKSTLRVTLKDDRNVKHNVTLDIPKVYNGKYIKVNGSKKIINKMLVMLPIVKAKENEVWITTNYKKLIIERFGRKINPTSDYIKRLFTKISDFSEYALTGTKISYKRGNSTTANKAFNVSIEYSVLSETILSLNINAIRLVFNQKILAERILKSKIMSEIVYDKMSYFSIGIMSNKILLSRLSDGKIFSIDKANKIEEVDSSITHLIIREIRENTNTEKLDKLVTPYVKANDSLTYSRVKIINKHIPMIILLGYEVGLIEILNRYNVQYEFVVKNPKLGIESQKSKIAFKDGFLVYDSSKLRNTLLLAGLKLINTQEFDFAEMQEKEPYLEYFGSTFSSRNVAKGIHNVMTLLIDPITKEILEDLDQPTNIIDILLYSNSMLEDMSAKQFNDMSIYRMRGAEQISAILYSMMSESFATYTQSVDNRNPVKISFPKDALIKRIVEQSTVDESSDLNPSLEIDKQTAITYRGPNGRNNMDSYTQEIRGYDPSMQGFLSMLSPDSATIGVVRSLSYDSQIKGIRGYIDTENNSNKSTSVYSPLELLQPFTSKYADPPRIGMQGNQQKHIVSTATNSKPLFGSGIEKAIAYQISDTFAIKAKQDGKIESIDDVNKLLIVSYANGKKDVFDLSKKLNKNSTGGFYVNHQLSTIFKVGESFNKGDIIAKNDNFFAGTEQGKITYTMGKLSKISLSPLDGTLIHRVD